jgi:hypothetical protein
LYPVEKIIYLFTPAIDVTEIRLVNGTFPGEGRVEVKHGEKWGSICDDSFDVNDAKVICRMLGFHNKLVYLALRYIDTLYGFPPLIGEHK